MANNKPSLLVGSQLPAFVQDDYQTFVAFLQAYYEYLEGEGKLAWAQEKLDSAWDVDSTLDAFLLKFKDQYLNQFPAEVLADKALMIKNIKQFYLSKGTEKSLKFLFRALFGEDITIVYPNRSILKVSDGKWLREQALRITGDVLNIYVGDGNTSSYIISDEVNSEANLHVTINDVDINANNYTLSDRTFTLTSGVVANGDVLVISIDGGDYSRFVGKQVFGETSGASAIVERYKRVYDKGQFYNELTITDLSKNFEVGENAYTFWVDDENNVSVKIAVPITSSVIDVEIVDGGAAYNVGDPLIFTSSSDGGSGAQAFVATIFKAGIRSIEVLNRGAGFKPGVLFSVSGGGGTGAAVLLNGVDTSGTTHPNTYNITSEIIHVYANTLLSANNYGFPAFSNANLNTALSQAFSYSQYGLCGPIDPQQVLIIQEGQDYITHPVISLDPPIFALNVAGNTANVTMTDFGILGSLKIYSAGENYSVGDEVTFTNQSGGVGQDAAAAVTAVSATGGISKIDFQPPRIGGSATVVSGSNTVLGIGTNFVSDVKPNASIILNNETQVVKTVTNANSMIIFGTWSASASNRKLGVYGRNFIGGSGYHMSVLPTVSVQSGAGSNANVAVVAVIGDGDDVQVSSLQPVGRIRTITVSQGGRGYLTPPDVDLSMFGDGTANALAQIAGGMFEYPGVYKSEDGFVSGSSRLHDRDFYQFYSYVIKSSKTLDTYEAALKSLIHPIGMKYFAEFQANQGNVTANVNMTSYDFHLDYKYVRILLSGRAISTKRMNYIVVPGILHPSGVSAVSKKKNFIIQSQRMSLSGTNGPGGTSDFFFSAPLMYGLLPEGTATSVVPTFSRPNVAFFMDYEARQIMVKSNEARFRGSRRVWNLIPTSNTSNAQSWATATAGGTISGSSLVFDGTAGAAVQHNNMPIDEANVAHHYVGSITLSANTQTTLLITLRDSTGGAGGGLATRTIIVPAGGIPQRFYVGATVSSTTGAISIQVTDSVGGGVSKSIKLINYQIERMTGAFNRAPSEYVANNDSSVVSPWYGAGVQGVRYFNTTNPFTQSGQDPVGTTTLTGNTVINATLSYAIPDRGFGYAYIPKGPNAYISTASTVTNSNTGNKSIVVAIAPDAWATALNQDILSKFMVANGVGWIFQINGTGQLRFNDGTGTTFVSPKDIRNLPANGNGGTQNGQLIWLRADIVRDNGANGRDTSFYYSYTGNNWNFLDTQTAAGASPLVQTGEIQIGQRQYAGYINRVIMWNGAYESGTPVLDFNPTDYVSGNSFVSLRTGEVWNVRTGDTNSAFIMRTSLAGYVQEEQATNLNSGSNDLSNVSLYGNSSGAILATANGTYGGRGVGVTDMTQVQCILAGGSKSLSRTYTGLIPNTAVYTAYIEAKAGNSNTFSFGLLDSDSGGWICLGNFNCDNTNSFIALGNGSLNMARHRGGAVTATVTAILPTPNARVFLYPHSSGEANGFFNYFANWQLTRGSPTSYIPTSQTAIQVRDTDVLSYNLAANGQYGKAFAEVTTRWNRITASVFAAINTAPSVNTATVINLGSLASPLFVDVTTGNISLDDGTASRGVAPFPNNPYSSVNNFITLESRWLAAPNNYSSIWMNKQHFGGSFDGNLNVGSNIYIGVSNTGSNSWNGTIRNVKLWGPGYYDDAFVPLEFDLPLMGSIVPNTSYFLASQRQPMLFTRASSALTLDAERKLIYVQPGEARFQGLRRVWNMLTLGTIPSENIKSGAFWSSGNTQNIIVANTTNIAAPDGTFTATEWTLTNNTAESSFGSANAFTVPYNVKDRTFAFSFWVYVPNTNGANTLRAYMFSESESPIASGVNLNALVRNQWQRVAFIYTYGSSASTLKPQFHANVAENQGDKMFVWHPQVEDISGQAVWGPNEYVSSGVTSVPYFGANVDGVKYYTFPSTNVLAYDTATTNSSNGVVVQVAQKQRLAWLQLPGIGNNSLTTANSAALSSIQQFLEAVWYGNAEWLNNTRTETFFGKWNAPLNQTSFTLRRNGTSFQFNWNDSSVNKQISLPYLPAFIKSNTNLYIRLQHRANNAANSNATTAIFYSVDGNNWFVTGNTVQTPANGIIAISSANLEIGTFNDGTANAFPGSVYRCYVANTFGGNPVADFNALDVPYGGLGWANSSTTGEQWFLNSNTVASVNASFQESYVLGANNLSYTTPLSGYFTEWQGRNLLLFTDNYANLTAWTANGLYDTSVTPNVAYSPDGSKTASLITSNGCIAQDGNVATGLTEGLVASVFVKKTQNSTIFPALILRIFGGGVSNLAYGMVFNTNSGNTTAIPFGTSAAIVRTLRDYKDYWRVAIAGNNNNANNLIGRLEFWPAWNGDGGANGNTILSGSQIIWGAQLESEHGANGSGSNPVQLYTPTTPITTNNSMGFRAWDVLIYPSVNVHTSWARGTVFAEFNTWAGPGYSSSRVIGDTAGAGAPTVPATSLTAIYEPATPLSVSSGLWDASSGVNTGVETSNNFIRRHQSVWSSTSQSKLAWWSGGDRAFSNTYSNLEFGAGASTEGLGIGVGGGIPFIGAIRNVKIWRRNLSDYSVLTLSNPGYPGNTSIEWNFTNNISNANSTVGTANLNVVRVGTSLRVNSVGFLEVVGNNTPRFDYHPITLQPRGLLIEETKTNLLLQSGNIANIVVWTTSLASTVPNALLAPDGNVAATKILDTSANNSHAVLQSVTAAATGYNFSIFLKAAERSFASIWLYDGTGSNIARIWANVSGGVFGSSQSVGTFVVTGTKIEPFINGWYRVSVAAIKPAGGSVTCRVQPATADFELFYPGDGASGIYAWGAQLEAARFPSSYIPTTSTSVARAADLVSTPLWAGFNQNAGSFVIDFEYPNAGANVGTALPAVWSFQSDASNRITARYSETTGALSLSAAFGGSVIASTSPAANNTNPSQGRRFGLSWTHDDWMFCCNNDPTIAIADYSGSVPFCNTFVIGSATAAFGFFNGWITKAKYWNYKIPHGFVQNIDWTL
jgi:hypothetical protein